MLLNFLKRLPHQRMVALPGQGAGKGLRAAEQVEEQQSHGGLVDAQGSAAHDAGCDQAFH